ncbi:piggyBac transposable element-derived protein 3-like [Hydra vulgaris]|uniref:PiggyBac transposable element-derived protein 3-like n=1 Tax=Hydra vulgaris TaxID=6087 RepID=A0ABM4CM49_HYDVU
MQLCLALKEMGFLVSATIRPDRTKGCQLATEKYFKKLGRGSQSFKIDANSGLILTKWYDNKCVNLISTYCDPEFVSKIKRWDRKDKKYIEIDCPSTVQEYNKSMGGVDLADMLISLFRTTIKTRRWYLKVFFHCLDIAKVNGWLVYRRH